MLLFLLGLTLGAIFGFDFRKNVGKRKARKEQASAKEGENRSHAG